MFLFAGEALWDLFAEERDGRLTLDARPGGSPLNAAVGLARMGHAAGLMAGISTDPMGERLVRVLEREDIDTRHLHRTDRPSPLSLVSHDANGEPAFAIHGPDTADREIGEQTLDDSVWGLHAGSFALVAEPIGSALLALFERERGRRLLTLDPNVRLGVQPDPAIWRDRVESAVRSADIVKASAEDIRLLYGATRAEEAARRWLAAGPALVIVTEGAAGAVAYTPASRRAVTAPRVEVADTVGAGDSFLAALVAGLAERGLTTRAALESGSAALDPILQRAAHAAALTCTRRGADPPRRTDLPPLKAA